MNFGSEKTQYNPNKYVVLLADYKNLLIQMIHKAHILESDIQIRHMFQIVAMWPQFRIKEYSDCSLQMAEM